MSRSYKKKPIVKDKGIKDYNKIFRRKERQALQEGKDPPVRTSEVVNDYDVSDWKFDARDVEDEELREKFKFEFKRK